MGFPMASILEWVAMPLLHGIFPTQGSNPALPALQRDSLPTELEAPIDKDQNNCFSGHEKESQVSVNSSVTGEQ